MLKNFPLRTALPIALACSVSVCESLLKALAVIVIFLGQIAAGTSVFNLCAFLLACFVVVLVRIYGLAGKAHLNRTLRQHVRVACFQVFFTAKPLKVKAKAPEGPTPVIQSNISKNV